MGMLLVAEGPTMTGVAEYETMYQEGDKGELRLYLNQELGQTLINEMEQKIRSQGVVLTSPIMQESRIIVIRFQKAMIPLAIIGTAVTGLGASLVGMQLFKIEPLGIPIWAWVVGGVALTYLIFRSGPGKAVVSAGKRYATHGVLSNPRRGYGRYW